MNERELIQRALARLPRPTPSPRLRRAVMTQVRREATEHTMQTGIRIQADGWTIEWRQENAFAKSENAAPIMANTPVTTHTWQHSQNDRGTTIVRSLETY